MNKTATRLLLIGLALITVAPAAFADVILSELCDPRNDYLTDRYIEVYNSGPAAVDLTGWQIEAVGNSSVIFTWNLSGTIAVGQALVAGDQTTVDVFPVDFPAEAWSNSNSTWNGKIGDGARLKNASGTVVDDAVVPGTTFENDWMERNEDITTPSLSFNLAQWTVIPVNTPSEASPGVHNPVIVNGPLLGAITTNPVAPLPGQTVEISAVVTDSGANITSVTLNWGTAAATLSNTIAMPNLGGDTFTTVTPIPAQTAGTTIFYAVTAANDLPAETVSAEQSYRLPFSVTVQDIQGTGTVSPHAGQEVITSGVVTADFGGTFVIQDGSGQYSGVWVNGVAAPALGTLVEVSGQVQELDANTTITGAQINSTAAGVVPAATVLTSGDAGLEAWEGVLVQVVNATCTTSDNSTPFWAVSNVGGSVAVDDLGLNPALVLGTDYSITGPLSGTTTAFGIVPRSTGDVIFVADNTAPTVLSITPQNPTSLHLVFTEDVSASTAQLAAHYTLDGGAITSAVATAANAVTLTVPLMANGNHTLFVDGVEDLFSNATVSLPAPFSFFGGDIPLGYYDSTEGLIGETLRGALHLIIDGHSAVSYAGLWSAFYSTDDKANGKVWDMYSDIPGGIPPYEYTFGIDQGGSAGSEGSGYNREHSWPSSWYGAISPMYTDIFIIYPTDNEVNNRRGSYPYGEVTAPTWTSLNGSKLGACSYPGYSGTVFEPIDEYKGDFARAYFYMSTRYFTEDSGWPGSPMASGSQLLPWAEAMLLEWNASDPVSTKEIDRNEAIYAIQHNRNPFIDRPDFVGRVFQPELSPVPQPTRTAALVLHQNVPNPFNPATTISYELLATDQVDLRVFDLAGHLVRTLVHGNQTAGAHQVLWQGRDQAGRSVATGVYFYRLQAGSAVETKRMILAK